MSAIAEALRSLLRFADNVPTDSQMAARMADGATGLAAIAAARAALAAHDAAAAECGIPALFKAIHAAQGELPESVQDAWDYLHLENVPRCFGGDA